MVRLPLQKATPSGGGPAPLMGAAEAAPGDGQAPVRPIAVGVHVAGSSARGRVAVPAEGAPADAGVGAGEGRERGGAARARGPMTPDGPVNAPAAAGAGGAGVVPPDRGRRGCAVRPRTVTRRATVAAAVEGVAGAMAAARAPATYGGARAPAVALGRG